MRGRSLAPPAIESIRNIQTPSRNHFTLRAIISH